MCGREGGPARMARAAHGTDRTRMRRCLATRQGLPRDELIRFVVGADGSLRPDLRERLPGRGYWIAADAARLDAACRSRAFDRAARRRVLVPEDLTGRIGTGLAELCIGLLGLANRAGQLGLGTGAPRDGAVLLRAADAPVRVPCGHGRMAVAVLDAAEIGSAIGRDRVDDAVLGPGRLAGRFLREARRLAGFRSGTTGWRQE